MNRRLPLIVRDALYSLRGGFLVRPLIIALVLGCFGATLSFFEETYPAFSDWVPATLFPSHTDPQVVQVILGGIAASIMTVVSIVFAILLMTLTLASMQFSPRIIVSFSRDHVTQWTLGIFLGTFLYCMAALPAAHTLPHPFAPVGTAVGAMLLAIACVALLLFFIHHISQAISVSQIVARIAAETEAMVDDIMPRPRSPMRLQVPDLHEPQTQETPVLSDFSGYIRYLDVKRLIFLATSYRVKVRVLRRVGQFVPAGVPILMVHKAERLSPKDYAEFLGAFDLGPARTLQQDAEFGVLQIVDIALKAISPAVNDPTTAINCVDQLSRILIRFASRDLPDSLLYDLQGVARVSVPWIDFEHLLESAFEQIRMYSKTDVAVSLRLLRALSDIASAIRDPGVCKMAGEWGKRIVEGCEEGLREEELRPIRVRLIALDKSLAAS
ncbi:MAG TPA: DUF2254 domain-containing protein [Verrucomicrobiae bacterium]|nr:DUF2254 domain-containing protein [Verrucomicrobiae bacterium]